jgi:hypothetical protein
LCQLVVVAGVVRDGDGRVASVFEVARGSGVESSF